MTVTTSSLTAALSGYLGAGHLYTTTDPDLLAWAIILWLLVKLLAGGDRRLWLAVGVTAGIGLENKDTLLFLAAGLAGGLVVTRRWGVVRSPWAWAAIGIALLLWVPNLAWQASNGWPQLTMARAISAYSADFRMIDRSDSPGRYARQISAFSYPVNADQVITTSVVHAQSQPVRQGGAFIA